ncbi:ArsO family NAD(P)H-dependent flavin-containing monooxygenase [Nocardioides sp.]|uniref:ArsO family NAD(P)H-dependent flavin-containing monooxygenase n=1 Tax=Nocardioides sp. TaxID=35761 RepID=UPI002ED98595
MSADHTLVDVAVVGGGQAGLAVSYYLRRAGLAPGTGYLVLDAEERGGGAWQHVWPSLTLFSPPDYSSLPGWPMPLTPDGSLPSAQHVVDYLAAYEARYEMPVRRPVRVRAVTRDDELAGRLRVDSAAGTWAARVVVSATGTWRRPFVPRYPGMELFAGRQLHSTEYRGPETLAGQRVIIVGGGNTAAQLLAELFLVARTTWMTLHPPRFLPDEVDGRVLFQRTAARRRALAAGQPDPGPTGSLGDIVMVPSVRAARDRGVLTARPMFTRLTRHGVIAEDGQEVEADVILWCTGFRPDLAHLAPLGLRGPDGRITVNGTMAVRESRLHLVGYGDWAGLASATLIGVGLNARAAVDAIVAQRGASASPRP